MKERIFSFSLVKTIEVEKMEILAFQHLAKEVKSIGNWKLVGSRQSIGSATVVSLEEKCMHTCRCVHTYTILPGNFRGFLS